MLAAAVSRSKDLTYADVLTASIHKILNLNHEPQSSEGIPLEPSSAHNPPQSTPILNDNGDPIWKVLVFDNMGRDVISSVLRVNDLRSWGVTIHLYACFPVIRSLYRSRF